MSEQPTTPTPPDEPSNDTEAASAVAAEAAAGGTHLADLAGRAKQIRGTDYDGTLTNATLIALEELLRQPTPKRYVKHIPPVNPGKPYPSTGLNSTQFQTDVLNAVLGRPHWRVLRHYPADKNGFLCKVVVIVGNELLRAKLDESGELVTGEADILAVEEEWGAVKNATTDGDAYKGSATNALKRALAAFGPGADVYRREFPDENVGGTGNLRAPAASQARGAQSAAGAARAATDAQRKLLRDRAEAKGLDHAQLANIILWAAQAEPKQYESIERATRHLDKLLEALPAHLVGAIEHGIDSLAEQIRRATAQTAHDAAAAAARERGVEYTGRSDIPADADVAPLAPVAVMPNGNGSLPHAA